MGLVLWALWPGGSLSSLGLWALEPGGSLFSLGLWALGPGGSLFSLGLWALGPGGSGSLPRFIGIHSDGEELIVISIKPSLLILLILIRILKEFLFHYDEQKGDRLRGSLYLPSDRGRQQVR